jgi:hypothetical protein
MEIGEFVVVVEDEDGRTVSVVPRISRSGRPMVGDEIEIAGAAYRVHRARFLDVPATTRRRYVGARLFARPIARGSRPLGGEPDPAPPFSGPRGAKVLPLRSSGAAFDEEAILPPALVWTIVACGYREQASAFQRYHDAACALARTEDGWFLDAALPERLWTLSRAAKRSFAQVALALDATACAAPPRAASSLLPRADASCARASASSR